MPKYFNKELLISIAATLIVFGGVVLAGTITPPTNTPSATFYTLNDIYNKITDPNYSYSAHNLAAIEQTNQTTMHSVSEIYDIVPAHRTLSSSSTAMTAGIYATTTISIIEPNLLPENIASGTEIFGVVGTY